MGTYDFILANGSDGFCARLLKCRCLGKKRAKRNTVRSQDANVQNKAAPPSLLETKKPVLVSQNPGVDDDIEKWKAEWLQKYGVSSGTSDLEKGLNKTVLVTPNSTHVEKSVALSPPVRTQEKE